MLTSFACHAFSWIKKILRFQPLKHFDSAQTGLWPYWHAEATSCLPSWIPFPSFFDHTTVFISPDSLEICYLFGFRRWLSVPELMRQRIKIPMIQAEDFGSSIIKGYKWDVVIYYIWHYKIISFTIKMIILVYLSVIVNVKPCLCIFSCGLSSWFIDSDWL